MKKAIIIGASSGLGRALAMKMLAKGYRVCGIARNETALQEIQQQFPENFVYHTADVRLKQKYTEQLQAAVNQLGGMDICVISSGISRHNPDLEWAIEQDVLDTNVNGFAQAAIFAARYFRQQGFGHLAGISSIAKNFGNYHPAYNASKAFEAIYLDGLRLRLERRGIKVTTFLPGFVETPMVKDQPRRFWSAAPEKAARQMLNALEKGKRYAFITRRWRMISWLLPPLPFALLKKIL